MKRKKWLKILAIIIVIYLVVTETLHWILKIDLKDHKVLGVDKCSACFGEDLCPEFVHGTIQIINYSFLTSLFNHKNVYYGTYKGENVVLKKLASNEEFREFEQTICDIVQRPNCNNVDSHVRLLASLWMGNSKDLDYAALKSNLPPQIETFACMKSQDLLNVLNRRHLKPEYFLTHSFINPEVLVSTAFPYEEGWPFPKHFGCCGRFCVFENAGQPLANFLNQWPTKARLALQVLQLALKMTFNDPILYLTDWSLDNFAVSSLLEVKLVDLENIVVVNRTLIKEIRAPGWDSSHHSVGFGCEGKFACFR